MNHKFVKSIKILPKESYTNKTLIIKSKKGKIIVYYINKYQNGKIKTKKFQPAKAKIPSKLKLSRELIEVTGLYQGDGQKSTKSKSYQSTRFSNSEPKLILKFIKFLKSLGVKNKDLKIYIRVRTRNERKVSEKEIINYWNGITKIPHKNFYKITQVKAKGTKYYKNGTATIIYSNSSFRVIFDSIFHYIKELSSRNKEYASYFLKGLIAADGNVYHNLSQREINIAAKSKRIGNLLPNFSD